VKVVGIVADALSIILGGLFGGKIQKRISNNNYKILAIAILIVSLVGFFENVYNIHGENINSENLLVVLFSFIIGSKIGEKLRIDERLSNLSKTSNQKFNAFIDSALFFGVGGLQISGPILLALKGNSSQLLYKSIVDLPFAIAFGAAYGKIVSVSAIPVAAIQIVIALTAYFFSNFFSDQMTSQLCAMGYIILFFSGYNLISEEKNKINI
jgi:uncharacterized membrane protein YqgA involved in biofilm formation